MDRLEKIEVISLVFSWDGLITKRNRFCCRKLGLSDSTIAYTQTRLLKTTLNMMNSESPSAAEIIHKEPRL